MARILDTALLPPLIEGLIIKACCHLPQDTLSALSAALERERSPYGRRTLELLLENAAIADEQETACCQDTGSCVIYMEIGQEVAWSGAPLREQIDEGVRRGYKKGYLRCSIARDPLDRVNTGDNTPAMLHTELVEGDSVRITVLPKGGGSENMGRLATLMPAAGEEGVSDFVLEAVRLAGGCACPPMVVGVGLGGTLDQCMWLAKKSLLRPIGERNADPRYAALEQRLLREINETGIGPLGMGGLVTALDVHIEAYPCHITALPVAVNLQCHSNRRATAVL